MVGLLHVESLREEDASGVCVRCDTRGTSAATARCCALIRFHAHAFPLDLSWEFRLLAVT